MRIFRRLFRRTARFFETIYWYGTRRMSDTWYDDGEQRFVPTERYRAGDVLRRTYGGENDILDMMLLKADHMICHLRKHAYQVYFYLDAVWLLKKTRQDIPHSDRMWAIRRTLERHFGGSRHSENVHSEQKHSKNEMPDNKLWIGNTYTAEYDRQDAAKLVNDAQHHSDSGLCHYYLVQNAECGTRRFCVIHETDEQIPPHKIPKRKKQYVWEPDTFLSGKKTKEAPQYRHRAAQTDFVLPASDIPQNEAELAHFCGEVQRQLDSHRIPISDWTEWLIVGEQSFAVTMADYVRLSDVTRQRVRGTRRTITELLHLRHLIKNVIKLTENDTPYHSFLADPEWETLSDEAKSAAMDAANADYLRDRQTAYRALADFMAAHGDTWWD